LTRFLNLAYVFTFALDLLCRIRNTTIATTYRKKAGEVG
jgi:hypothetical protein